MRRVMLFLLAFPLLTGIALAQEAAKPEGLAPPEGLEAADYDVDWGGTIQVRWRLSPAEKEDGFEGYRLYRSSSADGPFEEIGRIDPGNKTFKDSEGIEDGVEFFYRVSAVAAGVESGQSDPVGPAKAEANWFHLHRYPNLVAVWIFTGLLLGWIWTAGRKIPLGSILVYLLYTGVYVLLLVRTDIAWYWAILPIFLPGIAIIIPLWKGGTKIYVRPIPAIQAVEEAIGRATEMGKPILFVPGISTIEDVATLAALNILSPVAEKAAEYDSKLIVPNYDPIVYTVTQEVVKEAYLKAGRPDAYSDENVFYLSARQFAYAAAVNGLMVREKPATNFFLGMFYAESLLLAETGNMTGAIQIAGTDAVTQLPFFIVACDYTLIGEELYAAGAYMGEDPKLTGSLKGQDWNKALVLFIMLFFTLLYLVWGAFQDPKDWNAGWKNLPDTLFQSGGK